jgi:hypothetical protein
MNFELNRKFTLKPQPNILLFIVLSLDRGNIYSKTKWTEWKTTKMETFEGLIRELLLLKNFRIHTKLYLSKIQIRIFLLDEDFGCFKLLYCWWQYLIATISRFHLPQWDFLNKKYTIQLRRHIECSFRGDYIQDKSMLIGYNKSKLGKSFEMMLCFLASIDR